MENNFGLYTKSFNIICNEIKGISEIDNAVIFGSRAMGNYKKGSDVDIAVFGSELNTDIIAKLQYRLNEELPIPYYIDIVHFETIDVKELKEHILKEGKVIYNKKG